MEKPVSGEVICVEVPHPKSVRRFVEKRIEQWIALHNRTTGRLSRASFHVKFERLGAGHQIYCTVQLLVGRHIYRGTAFAAGLHKAMIACLDNLTDQTPWPTEMLPLRLVT